MNLNKKDILGILATIVAVIVIPLLIGWALEGREFWMTREELSQKYPGDWDIKRL